MADQKVSAMTDIVALVASDVAPIVRSGDPTNYKATMTEIATYTGAHVTLSAGSLLANTGTASAAGTSVTYGDPLSGGLVYNPTRNELISTPPTTYYLTSQPDASGVVGYYTAARAPNTTLTGTISAAITGSLQTVANFVAPPGDPGAIAYQAGQVENLLYLNVDAGAVTVTVRPYLRSDDGTETNMGTATAIALSSTTPLAVRIPSVFKSSSQTIPKTARMMFRVLATRVSGPATINVAINFDPTTYRNTAQSTITGAGVFGPDYVVNVVDYGAAGDLLMVADGVMSAGSATLTSATAVATIGGFKSAMVGRVVEVTGAGVAGATFIGTVASVPVDGGGTITLSGTADTATGTYYLVGASAPSPSGTVTGSYIPGSDQMTLQGGTFTTASVVSVVTTNVRSVTVNNTGSLGTDGLVTLTGTTGTGTFAKYRANVVSGALDPTSIAILGPGGTYFANPTLAADPVTAGTNPLTGATVTVVMDASALSVVTPGSYTVLPDDPIATSAGSVSGATGAEVSGSWNTTGRTAVFTNDLTAFTNAINAVNTAETTGGRTVLKIPARNYGFAAGTLPIATKPVLWVGDGSDQTQVYCAQGYTGAHIAGWSNIFPTGGQLGDIGPNSIVSAAPNGWGAVGIGFYGNRSATSFPDALVPYDRCGGGYFDDLLFDNVGSILKTGSLYAQTVAYLRESYFGTMRSRSCGTNSRPNIDLATFGRNAQNNNLQFANTNLVFPTGPALRITSASNNASDASKQVYFGYLRIEYQGSNPASSAGDGIQIGSLASTDEVADVVFNVVDVVSIPLGYSAVAFYGATRRLRPHNITFSNLRAFGGTSYGSIVSINAGYDIFINATRWASRSTNVIIGPRTDNRTSGTVVAGSSSSAVVLASTASSADSKYVGGALVLTSTGSGTATFATNVMTVTGSPTGTFRVGSIIAASGVPYGVTITALGTGTGGAGTYTLSYTTGTLGSRSVSASLTQTRYITAYVGATKTATVGACQGSAATYSWTPTTADTYLVDSLVEPTIAITANGRAADFTYSYGSNSDTVLSTSIFGKGDLTGNLEVPNSIQFTGTNGLEVGTPTGAFLGTGKVNTSGGVFKNNVEYGVGSVTSIVAAGALSGGTITGSGTIGLAVSNGLTISSAGTIAVIPATTLALGGIIAGANTTINAGGTLSVTAPGTGTVTSVAQTFTGGLISVLGSPITGSGTLALTVAGTSGGVGYFSSASTWASSAALGSFAIVRGGGAGLPPTTSSNFTASGSTLTVGNSGSTTGIVAVAGATSGTANITAQAVASTPTLTLPNTSGTFAVGATAPLVLSATTGGMTITNATTAAAGAVIVGSGLAINGGGTLSSSALANSVVTYTSTQTGTLTGAGGIATGYTRALFQLWGAGGGSGGGDTGFGTGAPGGGGGGGGGYWEQWFNVSALPATATFTVPAGGTAGVGGVAATSDGTSGGQGGAGTATSVVGTGINLTAYPGGGGKGGVDGVNSGGGGGGGPNDAGGTATGSSVGSAGVFSGGAGSPGAGTVATAMWGGGGGGGSGTSGAAGGAGASAAGGGPGGGGGGSCNAAATTSGAGGVGGSAPLLVGPSGGANTGAAGTAGTAAATVYTSGSAGSGGGGSKTTNGGAGGAGGVPAGGAGGGGGCDVVHNGGAGAIGGRGQINVLLFY